MLTVVLVGCTSFDYDEDEGDEDGLSYAALAGTKTLSKSENYDFDAALEGYSTNFFNLFAKEVLQLLYGVYENPTLLTDDEKTALFDADYIFQTSLTTESGDASNTLTTTNDITWDDLLDTSNGVALTSDAYYLFDSIRYTLADVAADESDVTTVTFDTTSAWNWTVEISDTYKTAYELADITLTDAGSGIYTAELGTTTFETFYESATLPDFLGVYYSTEATEKSTDIVDFYASPYYSQSTLLNQYQDLLEYVTYLFVLGGSPTGTYSECFEWEFSSGSIVVGGWADDKISLSGSDGALAKVKAVFESIGEYVGLTSSDLSEIVDYILNYVIGEDAQNAEEFTVTISSYVDDPAGGGSKVQESSSKTFNRNYTAMVERIVDLACASVPIGEDSNGDIVSLDENFRIAEITDYKGNYFFAAGDFETGEGAFDNIVAQEFQSLVIFPTEDDVLDECELGLIMLMIEYGADDDGTQGYADEITIEIGGRYFNHNSGEVEEYGSATITVKKGSIVGKELEEYEYIIASTGDEGLGDLFSFRDGLTFNSTTLSSGKIEGCFNNDIGDGVINALEYGTSLTGSTKIKSITLTAGSTAKNYYKSTASSGYGTYATLDEDMFKGDDGCDFFEIYFNVQKTGSSLSEIAATNYNFKVAFEGVMFL